LSTFQHFRIEPSHRSGERPRFWALCDRTHSSRPLRYNHPRIVDGTTACRHSSESCPSAGLTFHFSWSADSCEHSRPPSYTKTTFQKPRPKTTQVKVDAGG
jgi:hypothetical protein